MVKRDNGVLLNDAISLHSGLCLYLLVCTQKRPCLQAVFLTGVLSDNRLLCEESDYINKTPSSHI